MGSVVETRCLQNCGRVREASRPALCLRTEEPRYLSLEVRLVSGLLPPSRIKQCGRFLQLSQFKQTFDLVIPTDEFFSSGERYHEHRVWRRAIGMIVGK